MPTSIREIFKIGIGPSSSHTVGPMKAASQFRMALMTDGAAGRTETLRIELFGALALTGRGHGTPVALILGLLGESPEQVELQSIDDKVAQVRTSGLIPLPGPRHIVFRESDHLVWRRDTVLADHPNAMRFTALAHDGDIVLQHTFYSIGGGFIRRDGEPASAPQRAWVPYAYSTAAEMVALAKRDGIPLWELVRRNEAAMQGVASLETFIESVWREMRNCIARGMRNEGTLPGGLLVRRRARALAGRLQSTTTSDPLKTMDWVAAFAMAVNEENAAGRRVVTAPTNGAAGVVPAVAKYYETFVGGASRNGLERFFLVAGAIGALYKDNASISGAEVGCQGEVGVACSMAAAGLAAAYGGTPEQIEHAAEIGMEHHLGMTCDPVAGLVQIPCIERNAVGAVKAITACRMALQEDGPHRVSLDQVMKTMLDTGRDMQSRYKETSLGGLAINVVAC